MTHPFRHERFCRLLPAQRVLLVEPPVVGGRTGPLDVTHFLESKADAVARHIVVHTAAGSEIAVSERMRILTSGLEQVVAFPVGLGLEGYEDQPGPCVV